jgi:hypothetical protein
MYSERVSSGSPLAVVDMNGDHLDDIVHLEQGRQLYVNYQDPNGDSFIRSEVLHTYREAQWSVVVADFDRNGWRDIFVGGAYENFFVFFQDNGVFSKDTLRGRELYAQATNAVDIDNDGWTDIFMCNDVGHNVIWWNRQGRFVRDTTGLFTEWPSSLAAGNYGSEWSDVDNDGDLDLYIAKCYAQAPLPSSPNRINQLYINNGDGTFSEEAAIRGVATGAQSWTGHFYDADNDGDQDLLVSNHDQIAEFFINDGSGHFEDATMRSRLRIGGPVIQCMALDVNGDGWQDVAVGGVPDYLYEYRPSGVYQQLTNELGPYDITSYAIGDLNNDNVPDLYATVGNLIQLPSSIQDRCFYGTSSNDNALSVLLKGVSSNPDGIGAKIEVFYQDGIQSKVVKAGESYGVQNSFKQIFFSPAGRVDSVRVIWPDGGLQVQYDLLAPDLLVFWQGQASHALQSSGGAQRYDLCSGDTLMLGVPDGLGQVTWSNGMNGDTIMVTAAGFYQATICRDQGPCLRWPGALVTYDKVPEAEIRIEGGDEVICHGEEVVLDVEMDGGWTWEWLDNGLTGPRAVAAAGEYVARIYGACGTIDVTSGVIQVIDPDFELVREDTIDRSITTGRLEAHFEAGTTEWYRDAQGGVLLGIGNVWDVTGIENDTTIYAEPVFTQTFDTLMMGETELIGAGRSPNTQENAGMLFEIEVPAELISVDVYSVKPGRRCILLLDRDRKKIDSLEVELDTGWHTLELAFELQPEMGPFILTTDSDVNMESFQHRWPALTTNFNEVKFPYSLDRIGFLSQSWFGYDRYDYFYRWRLSKQEERCVGERVPLTVYVRTGTTVAHVNETARWKIAPNPNPGAFIIYDWKGEEEPFIQVYNSLGRSVPVGISMRPGQIIVTISGRVESGVYLIRVGEETKALVVQP